MKNNGRIKFFLIDDDADDQELFTMALQGTGKNVESVCADSGPEAIHKLQDENYLPDYIFIDMNMPQMNGKQVLYEIKKMERLRNVPVFMYSTSADPNTIAETKDLGASGFIMKPTSLSALTDTIVNLLKHRKK